MDDHGLVFGNSAPLQFLDAEFNDSNAGAGDAESGAFESLRSGIINMIQHQMNQATAVVPDERDYTRSWRTRDNKVLLRENEAFVGFLEKPLEDWPAVDRHRNFLHALNTTSISSSSRWLEMHVASLVNKEDVLAEINSELTAPLDGLRDDVHKLLDMYLATLSRLFDLEGAIAKKMDRLERLQKHLEGFTAIEGDDDSEEAHGLQSSVLTFVKSRYKSWGIESDFKEFIKQFTRFQAFRSVLLAVQAGSDTEGNPICSICTVGSVSTALIPCGHVFCGGCAQKQRSQCYVCRTSVHDRLRIYFS
jgi:hypothetical protein